MWSSIFQVIRVFGPRATTAFAKWWPVLMSNPQFKDLIDKLVQKPRQGRGYARKQKLEALEAVVNQASASATTPEHKETVEAWHRSADALRLGLPLLEFGSAKARRERRASWDADLDQLVADILQTLGDWTGRNTEEA